VAIGLNNQAKVAELVQSLPKWIAETHQAELSVESEEGSGTSFSIVFPRPEMMVPKVRPKEVHPEQSLEQACNV
jgi:hypothetical protein